MVLLRCACRRELLGSTLRRWRPTNYRPISTSDKKKEVKEACPSVEDVYKKIPDFSKPLEQKGWQSFGFDKENYYEDLYKTHSMFFWSVSVILVGGFFVYLYRPDYNRLDWAKREAFIRLQERELLGLDPVDVNYVDPSQVVLPPDEELDEEDIII